MTPFWVKKEIKMTSFKILKEEKTWYLQKMKGWKMNGKIIETV